MPLTALAMPPPFPFSILCLDPIPLLRPLGRSTEATVCTFPALIPSTVPRPRSYFNFKLTQQCGSCDPKTRWWPRLWLKKKHMSRQVERNTLPIHRKSLPQSGIYRGELFTVGNSEIPDFCLSSLASRENPWFLNLSLPKEEGDKI